MNNMKTQIIRKKFAAGIILALNIVGIICLAYFAIPYLAHDTAIPNPGAMLPMERWDAGGMALTIGLIPLAAANILALRFVGEGLKKPLKSLFLVPSIICIGIVAHYWISSTLGNPNTSSSEPVVKGKVEFKDNSEIQYGLLYDDCRIKMPEGAFAAGLGL